MMHIPIMREHVRYADMNASEREIQPTIHEREPLIVFLGDTLKVTESLYPDIHGLGQLICTVASEQYSKQYLGWELTRKKTYAEIVGQTNLTTGFEGYIVHAGQTAEDRFKKQAELAYIAFQKLDPQLYSLLLEHKQITNLTQLHSLYRSFLYTTSIFKAFAAQERTKSEEKRNAYDSFAERTKSLTAQTTNIVLLFNGESLAQAYTLPDTHVNPAPNCMNVNDLRSYLRDPMHLLAQIGIMGHPVARLLEANPILRSRIDHPRYFLPPRGSDKRTRLDESDALNLLSSL